MTDEYQPMHKYVQRKVGATDVWLTPPEVFDYAVHRWGPFDLDAAAGEATTKCERYISEVEDALKTPWDAKQVWVNPPYGSAMGDFMARAVHQVEKGVCERVVALIAVRADTKAFQEVIFPNASEIHFIAGRISFGSLLEPGKKIPANFASCFVVFDKRTTQTVTYGPLVKPVATAASFDLWFQEGA